MSLPHAVLDAMMAAGCTAEQIVAAVKAADGDAEIRREAKRASNAERQRRFKARRNDETPDGNAGNALPNVTAVTPALSPFPNENKSNPNPHTHPDNKPARKGKIQPPAKPDDVSPQIWADFLNHRKTKGSPVSETATTGIRREAEKAGWAMNAALTETVLRGWQGFKAEWVQSDAPKAPPDQSAGNSLMRSIHAHKSRQEPTPC